MSIGLYGWKGVIQIDKNNIYVPRLIIALTDDKKYVHVKDFVVETTYYCPCCGSEVKPRSVSGKVQPHFYHVSADECRNETIAHWIYKHWLFEKGKKFIIGSLTYTVKKIEIEHTFYTPFGEYRPDISVECEDGKCFFFEIAYSTKKNRSYSDIWTYLNIDVIEVDIRELIHADFIESTPQFETIFSNGIYLKKYIHRQISDKFYQYKQEYQKNALEDILKTERLSNLWVLTKSYIIGGILSSDVIQHLDEYDYEDTAFAVKMFKKLKCIDLFFEASISLRNRLCINIKNSFVATYNEADFEIFIEQFSKYKWKISILSYLDVNGRKFEFNSEIYVKSYDGVIESPPQAECDENILFQLKRRNKANKALVVLEKKKLEYGLKYFISSAPYYNVFIQIFGFPFNKTLSEQIYSTKRDLTEINASYIDEMYHKRIEQKKYEMIEIAAKTCFVNTSKFKNVISELNYIYNHSDLSFNIIDNTIIVKNDKDGFFTLYISPHADFIYSADKIKNELISVCNDFLKYKESIFTVVSLINKCSNSFWYAETYSSYSGYGIKLKSFDLNWLSNINLNFHPHYNYDYNTDYVKKYVAAEINRFRNSDGYYFDRKRLIEVHL